MYFGPNPSEEFKKEEDKKYLKENFTKIMLTETDPFSVFGLGMSSFHQLNRNIIRSFVICSLLATVMICINLSHTNIFEVYRANTSLLLRTTLGNLGASFQDCHQQNLGEISE